MNILLRMDVCKSEGKTDKNGNYVFEVEASNENLDLEQQAILQNALLNSKDFFLSNGVVSWDHLHNKGDGDTDPFMVIGEPLEVFADGKSTIVKGILYKDNQIAQDIKSKLANGSKRIRASVGGILPEKRVEYKNGKQVEVITGFIWNDLALTTAPVNSTVGYATLIKSFTSQEFVKALSVGTPETDHTSFTGGRALVPEDIKSTVDIVSKIYAMIKENEISSQEEMKAYLIDNGIQDDFAEKIIFETIEKLEKEGMDMALREKMEALKKSLGKGKEKKVEGPAAEDSQTDEDEVLDLDDENDDTSEDDDIVRDAAPELKALKKSIDALSLVVSELSATTKDDEILQKSMAEALIDIGEEVAKIGSTPEPRKSTVVKSISTANVATDVFINADDIEEALNAVNKSVRSGNTDIYQASRMESGIKKSLGKGSFELTPADVSALRRMLEVK